MPRTSLVMLTIVILLTALPLTAAAKQQPWEQEPRPAPAALPAPSLPVPPDGTRLGSMGAVTLQWSLPAGSTQYQLQVTPHNGDGPGVNLIRNAESQFIIPAPPTWYVLLPGMTYTWRVRVTDATGSVSEGDPSWGAWSPSWRFTTPQPTAETISPTQPPLGTTATSLNPTLVWTDANPGIFYYEIQLSSDPLFNTDPFTATAAVYWNLVHGGETSPQNSWAVPLSARLETGTRYYWRVRPRVQGNGTPIEWGGPWSFRSPDTAQSTPTPTVTTSPVPTGTPIPVRTATPSATITPTASPAATATPMATLPNKIAFISIRENHTEIYTMNADGSGQTQISNENYEYAPPIWSPNGKQIAFTSGKGVVIADIDGTNNIALNDFILIGDWSRVTGGILVGRSNGHYIIRPDDTSSLIINDSGGYNLTWSPVDSRIMFVSNSSGDSDIYVMNMDGSGQVNLSNNKASDTQPAWSPDGTRIAFISNRDGNTEVYVMSVDGSNQTRITQTKTASVSPVWSPDGKKIAFSSLKGGVWQVFSVNPDGTGMMNLTNTGSQEQAPVWSPDGRKIAFTSTRDQNQEVYLMNADGTGQVNLTNNDTRDYSPAWSPR